MTKILDNLRYTKDDEWVRVEGDEAVIGISDHAQKEITDVVFVDLPKVGRDVKAGEAVAVVESVKAAFDIYAPVSGKISKVNANVSKNPALVNQSAYGEGWLFSIEKTGDGAGLMNHADYQKFLLTDAH